jgi:hypothetical protein
MRVKEMSEEQFEIGLIESFARSLLDEIPPGEWKSAGYAKAELLFIIISAAIISGEVPSHSTLEVETTPGGPTLPTGRTSLGGDLLSKPSVQSAVTEFLSEGANWADLYKKWEVALDRKDVSLPIRIWRGVATQCAIYARR